MTGFKNIHDLCAAIETELREKNVWADVYADFSPLADKDPDTVKVDISWGDWKHDHLRADWVVKEFLNSKNITFLPMGEYTTEEDGSDCYSAIHSFVIMNFRWEAMQA